MAGSITKVDKKSTRGGIFKFFREVKSEIKRVNWPSKNETVKALIAVVVVAVIYIIMVGGFDYIFQNLFEWILKLK